MSSTKSLLIPELDFSHSPSSFVSAVDIDLRQRTSDDWTDASSVSTVKLSKTTSDSSRYFEPTTRDWRTHQVETAVNDRQAVVLQTPQSHVRKRLVKRNRSPTTPRKGAVTYGMPTIDRASPAVAKYFRCDIHATNGQTYRTVETVCKRLVTDAGGTILDDVFIHPGGFLYELPANAVNPLMNDTEVCNGSKITVRLCTRFPRPNLREIKMCALTLESVATATTSSGHRSCKRTCSSEGMKSRIGSWLSGLTRDYGGRIDYLQPSVAAGM